MTPDASQAPASNPLLRPSPSRFPPLSASTPTALMSLPADYLARRICSSMTPPAEEFVLQHKSL